MARRKIVDSEGFHIPVKQERSYAESVPSIAEQRPKEENAAQAQQNNDNSDENAAAKKPIGKEEVSEMLSELRKYISSKAPYDERYKNNFDTYTLLYTDNNVLKSEKGKDNGVIKRRRGAQTLKVILNKHADAMDNYPEAVCLPRSSDDEETAKQLTCVLPCILERNKFYKTYNDASTDALVGGAYAVSVTWDPDRDGIGEVCVRRENILNLFWQPFIEDIQQSKYFFNVEMMDIEAAKKAYPVLKDVAADDLGIKEFKTYDNSNKSQGKAAIVDCYYKRGGEVHLCKFCGETLISASENEPKEYPKGYYIGGEYPFIVKPLFRLPETPTGFGFIDICRAPQEYMDELKLDMLKNIKVNSKTRNLKHSNAGVNDEDLLDLDQEMIEVDGIPLDQAIRPLETKDIAPGALSVYSSLNDEIKDTTGTNDAANGASAAGVTSGNAIAALQEAGGKISRDINKMDFFAFTEICNMIIERMRQFYTPGRMFRIIGDDKKVDYIEFDGNGLREQKIEVEGSDDDFFRLPIFDIEVKAQRSNPFTTAANNQMMIDMFNMGLFNPDNTDAALVALEGMSFEGKDKIIEMLKKNKTLVDAVNDLSQQLQMSQTMISEQTAQQAAQEMPHEETAQFPVNVPQGAKL